jgi:hypothetical protein
MDPDPGAQKLVRTVYSFVLFHILYARRISTFYREVQYVLDQKVKDVAGSGEENS